MRRVVPSFLVLLAVCLAFSAFVRAQSAGQAAPQAPPAPGGRGGWTIPQGAADEKTPLTVTDSVIAAGKKLYSGKCQRCHGPEGKGNGPDADPAHANDMNLTLAARAARNPDGVVFYKLWNGRTTPKMPKFSDEISKDQAWAIVAYVQTLRAKQ